MPERLLADLTTLRLGGPARELVRAGTEDALLDAVRTADAAGTPLLLVAGGSNLVVADDGFDGTVVRIATRGVAVEQDTCGGAVVTVAAGEPWDPFVARAVGDRLGRRRGPVRHPGQRRRHSRAERRRLRPGGRRHDRLGAVLGPPRRRAAHVLRGRLRVRLPHQPVQAGPRPVRRPGRHASSSGWGDLSSPVRYAELARTLGVDADTRAPMTEVREAVLSLRRGKGMVLDAADHDTWSAGSFFTNPFVTDGSLLPNDAPRWPQADGSVKTSAAWLIEHAGFSKGYGTDRVALSGKHTLALTNRGSARTEDLLALAAEVQRGVHEKFGVWLVNEPTLVGCELPGPDS